MRIPTLSESPVATLTDGDGLHLPPLPRPTLIRRLKDAAQLLATGDNAAVIDLLSAPDDAQDGAIHVS